MDTVWVVFVVLGVLVGLCISLVIGALEGHFGWRLR